MKLKKILYNSIMLILIFSLNFIMCSAFDSGFDTEQDVQQTTAGDSEIQTEYTIILPGCSDGGNISVVPQQDSYAFGQQVIITAVASDGFVFDGWSADSGLPGNVKISGDCLKLMVSEDADLSTIIAVFADEQIGNGQQTLGSGSVIDTSSPYCGDYVMIYSPGFSDSGQSNAYASYGSQSFSESAEDDFNPNLPAVLSEITDSPNEYTRIELHDTLVDDRTGRPNRAPALSQALSKNDTPQELALEDEAVFKTYDLSINPSTLRPKYEWIDTDFILKGIGENVYVWFEKDNPAQISDEQFEQMVKSFDSSYEFITDNMTEIYDRNGNGKLDVLIYDIQDSAESSGVYYSGFFSANDLYTSIANCADIIHIDTYPTMVSNQTPDISQALRTMAHETQHLACASWYNDKYSSNRLKEEQFPPLWINEGLSMAVEHELFGVIDERINAFNSISGGFSLNHWSNNAPLKSYALSYVFFQYLKSQGGGIDALSAFYAAYDSDTQTADGNPQDNLNSVLQQILSDFDAFSGMSIDQIIQAFYAAVMLKEPDGIYGFCGDPIFEVLSPAYFTEFPDFVPSCGAVYVKTDYVAASISNPQFMPMGLTRAEYYVNISPSEGGTTSHTPQKQIYHYGDSVKFSAEPNDGMLFVGWSGDVADTDKYKPEFTVQCRGNIDLTANFAEAAVKASAGSYNSINISDSDARLEYACSSEADTDADSLSWHSGNGGNLKIEGLNQLTDYYIYVRCPQNPSDYIVLQTTVSTPKKPASSGGGSYSKPKPPAKPDPDPDPEITEPPVIKTEFNDLKGHWAERQITQIAQANILNGYPDGFFRPDNPVTRAEFITVLMRALEINQQTDAEDKKAEFYDTDGHWAGDFISSAAERGYINGKSNGNFEPDEYITREQLAVIVAQVLKNENAAEQQPSDVKFADWGQISPWAADAVKSLSAEGILVGYTDNTFRPKQNLTRAETAVIIARLIENMRGE